jgi:hypothetical protein
MARKGCVAEVRSSSENITRSLDGLPSLAPLSAFAKDIFPKLQADMSERVNLIRFANLAPTLCNRARPESRRFASRLSHGALTQGLDPDPKEPRIHETTRVRTWSRGSGP